MILTADLHLKPESADTVLTCLESIRKLAKQHEHNCIAILGDVFHVRYSIPVETLNRLDDTIRTWSTQGIETIFLVGNHDSVDVNGQNALQVLKRPGVRVYSEPTIDEYGTWLPYRKDIGQIIGFIDANKPTNNAFLHHGLQGAMMNSNMVAGELDGLPIATFQKYQHVWLGHWHRHQTIANCTYVGSPWQTRADESGQQKGAVELNEKTGAWRFHPIEAGPRFFKGDGTQARRGDVVRLPYGTDKKEIESLQAQGVDVRIEPPPQTVTAARSGLNAGATLREHAIKYVDATATADLDKDTLMKLFDEIAA